MQQSDLVLRGLRRKIKLAEVNGATPSAPAEVELIRCGTFHHPQYGKFEITPDVLLSFKKNFDANVRGIDIAVDYMHASEAEAAGWIREVTLKENGTSCWIGVDWTPNGTKMLSDKEFRYISADFQLDYKDNESLKSFGPTLMGAGLTNRPVVKKMNPVIELSEGKGQDMQPDPKDKQIEDLKAQLADMTKKCDELQAASKPPPPPAKPAADPSKDVELASVKDENKQLSEKIKKMEVNSTFDKMLSEGKVVEAQRAPFIAGDMVKFSELAQPVNKTAAGGAGNPTPEPEAKDADEAQEQILKLADAKVKEGSAKDKKSAINMVLAEQPALSKKAYSREA